MHPYTQLSGTLTVDLIDPDPDDLVLHSLAKGLAYTNRFTGAIGTYSVAEHLVLGMRCLRDRGHKRGILAGYLLHDAHEAIIGDVSAPVKAALLALGQDFSVLEDRHQIAIEKRFAVFTRAREIKAMDRAMCLAEAEQGFGTLLTRGGSNGWPAPPSAEIKIQRWAGPRAAREWLEECNRLGIR